MKKVNNSELASAAEIARQLHLQNAETVHTWHRELADFPSPWVRRGDGEPLWAVPGVERWAEGRGWRG